MLVPWSREGALRKDGASLTRAYLSLSLSLSLVRPPALPPFLLLAGVLDPPSHVLPSPRHPGQPPARLLEPPGRAADDPLLGEGKPPLTTTLPFAWRCKAHPRTAALTLTPPSTRAQAPTFKWGITAANIADFK